MRRSLSYVMTVVFALSVNIARADEEAPKVKKNSLAVMDTVAQNAPDALAALTTQTLSSYAANNLGLDVISKDDVRKLVNFEQLQQLTGGDASGASAIGSALGVEKLMTSTLGKIGDKFQLSVVVMDAATAKVVGRGTRELRSEDEIVENARDLAHFALKNEQRESKGYVRLSVTDQGTKSALTGAAILIDGTNYGVSPLATPIRILAGKHQVHVEKKGYLPFNGFVTVDIGAEAALDVTLISESISSGGAGFLPWAGATAGVAVVGGVVSILAYNHALNVCKTWGLDSKNCGTAGQAKPATLNELNNAEKEVDLYGNKVAFYGGIGSAVVGGVSVVLFSTYFILNYSGAKSAGGAGGDEPSSKSTFPVTIEPTANGVALRF